MYFIRRTTWPEYAGTNTNPQIVLNTPKKSLPRAIMALVPTKIKLHPKKYPENISYQKKSRNRNFKPKNSFYYPHHLKSKVLYSTANDPLAANDPQNGPQMILDRKWSREENQNGLESSYWIILSRLLSPKKKVFIKLNTFKK